MIYLKWLSLAALKFLLLPTLLVVPPIVAAFCRARPHDLQEYTWGGWWGTFDNPPQGDEGFVRKHALFPDVTTGLKGYVNRVQWMLRNKLYGFNRFASIPYNPDTVQYVEGKDGISDKDKIPGWYFVRVRDLTSWKILGFEFYGVFPYSETRNARIRLGWKILTDKYKRYGFAQLVTTANPVDGYGEN